MALMLFMRIVLNLMWAEFSNLNLKWRKMHQVSLKFLPFSAAASIAQSVERREWRRFHWTDESSILGRNIRLLVMMVAIKWVIILAIL